jgi:hypothetical protein
VDACSFYVSLPDNQAGFSLIPLEKDSLNASSIAENTVRLRAYNRWAFLSDI